MITHATSPVVPISLWSLIRPFCERLVFEPVGDQRDHEALNYLMDQGGGLAREWDERERRISPNWGKGLGKEDRDAQDKRCVSHFSLGLALLKVIAFTQPAVGWWPTSQGSSAPPTCPVVESLLLRAWAYEGVAACLMGASLATNVRHTTMDVGCYMGHSLRRENQKN